MKGIFETILGVAGGILSVISGLGCAALALAVLAATAMCGCGFITLLAMAGH